VLSVSSHFYAGGSVCGRMCVYTHTHTHTAQMGYSVVSPGVGMRRLEGPKNPDRLNLSIYVFVYVYKVYMCMYMLGDGMRSWTDCFFSLKHFFFRRRMPWGSWLEYNDDRMLSEAWNAATEEFSEDWPSTAVHQIQGARITLSVSYNQKDWGAMQEWIAFACSTWHSKADSASASAPQPVAEAAVSSTALSNAANSVGGYTAGTL